nr:hypothetical protein [Tanacetum cinerariifolium]
MESQSETTQMVSALKLLVLITGKYNLWGMRMEKYLTFTDHALWEVIVNVDLVTPVSSANIGAEGPIPSKTAKQKLARKNELKAKNTLSMDDLYNNLKVYEFEIKSQSSSSSISHNVAFVSSDNSSSTNETVNTAHSVSAASPKDQASTASYVDDVMFSFFSNQSNAPQLDNEDLEQIDTDDLKEMYLKWKVAMLTMRDKRFIKKTGRKLDLNGKETIRLDRTKVECYNYHRRGYFARECRAPRNQGNRNRGAPTRNAPVDTSTTNALVVQDGIGGYDWRFQAEEVLTNFVLMAYTSQGSSSSDSEESDSEDENVFKPKEVKKTVKPSLEKIKFIKARNTTVKNKDKAKKPKKFSQSPRVLTKSGQVPVNAAKQSSHRAASSVSAARHVNTVASRPNVNNVLPTTYSYFKAYSPVRRPFNQKSAAKINNFNEKVNTAKVNNVTTVGQKAIVSVVEENRNNDVMSPACWIWKLKGNLIHHISKDSGSYTFKRFNYGNPQYALQDQEIFDNGCSRHMIGNTSYLTDYQESDGGFLLDKSQVLLKVPRNNNMYSFDLKNVVSAGGRKPALSFMRPFGCPITILNTLDHLGTRPNWMFDIDTLTMSMNYQPVFAGNQTNGNTHTKANIDARQAEKKMVPGPQYVLLPLLNFDSHGPKSSEDEVADDARKKSTEVPRKENGVQDLAKEDDKNNQENDLRDQEEALRKQFKQESKRLFGRGKSANTNSTNRLKLLVHQLMLLGLLLLLCIQEEKEHKGMSLKVCLDKTRMLMAIGCSLMNEFESMFGQDKDANGNRMFTHVSAVGSSHVNLGGSIPINVATHPNADLPTDPLMPDLEDTDDLQDTRIFSGAYDDEVVG